MKITRCTGAGIFASRCIAALTGKIDFTNNDLKLRGVVLPLSFLQGQGVPWWVPDPLIGAEYEMAGPLQAPSVRIDPIAALAPGILR
jgi:hypothetical protein